MLEQNLAALFRGFATEMESRRASLASVGPEADDLIAVLDDLEGFLLDQAQRLEERPEPQRRREDSALALTELEEGGDLVTNRNE